jgi:hypothetical protein
MMLVTIWEFQRLKLELIASKVVKLPVPVYNTLVCLLERNLDPYWMAC